MKKVISFMSIMLFCFSCFSYTVSAADLSTEVDITMFDEKDRAEMEVLLMSHTVLDIVNPSGKEDRDLKWAVPYKRYVNTNILTMDTASKEDIINTLEAGDYCYDMVVFKDGLEMSLTFSKGVEPSEEQKDLFTEEEYQYLLDHAGKWVLNSYGYVEEGDMSYYRALNKYGLTAENDIIIAASQPGLNYPVIIEFVDDVATYIYPIYDLRGYPIFVEENSRSQLTVTDNGSYLYSEVALFADDYKSLKDVADDVQSKKALIYIVIALVIFAVLILIPGLLRKRDFRRQVAGKTKERDLPDNYKVSYDKDKEEMTGTDAVGAASEINARRNWFHM